MHLSQQETSAAFKSIYKILLYSHCVGHHRELITVNRRSFSLVEFNLKPCVFVLSLKVPVDPYAAGEGTNSRALQKASLPSS